MEVPLHEPVYHFHEAAVPRLPPDNDNVDELPLHMLAGDADALVAAVDCAPRALPQEPPWQATQTELQPGAWLLSATLG
jgi:hypothetical protein